MQFHFAFILEFIDEEYMFWSYRLQINNSLSAGFVFKRRPYPDLADKITARKWPTFVNFSGLSAFDKTYSDSGKP